MSAALASILCALLLYLVMPDAFTAEGEMKLKPNLPGVCPDFTPMESLDSPKLNGEWFGVYGLTKGFEKQSSVKCVKKTFTAQPEGGFEVIMTMTKDGQSISKTSVSTPIDGQNSKLAIIKDSSDTSEKQNMSKTATILGTDYEGYLVTAFCVTDGTNHGYMIYAYSRSSTLDDVGLEKVKAVLQTENINNELIAFEGC